MKTKAKLILSVLILFSALAMQRASCKNVTAAADTLPAFSFDILPEIERDLALCDLYKQRIPLLTAQVALRTAERDQERREKVAAQKLAKREKRKRVVSHIIRTVAEVGAALLIIKIL